jgi:ABC-type xylose transport system permease subunit
MEAVSAVWKGGRPLSFSMNDLRVYRRFIIPILSIIGCSILFHWWSDGAFLTARNLSNLSRQVCVNLTLAVGMTIVILTSGIDLSVGSVLALCGMVSAITQVHFGFSEMGAMGAILSFLAAIAVGGLCGAITGFSVSRFRITPFIVTLGMMVICRGMTLIISGAQAVAPVGVSLGSVSSDYLPTGPSFVLFLTVAFGTTLYYLSGFWKRGYDIAETVRGIAFAVLFCGIGIFVFCGYRGVPYMVFLSVLCALIGVYVLKYTRFGRFVYAVGGNREAAELSGVPVTRTLWITYFTMGVLAGLAGVMDTARVNGAVPSAGELAELDAIAAVVIGGTSLMGGIGTIGGTVFGVLIMGILNNGMSLVGISEHYQKVFKGAVIILAVYLDLRSKKKS